jgi:hypothetical protein
MKEHWSFSNRQNYEETLKYPPKSPCYDDKCLVRSTCFDAYQDNEIEKWIVRIDKSCEKGRNWIMNAWERDQFIKKFNSLPKSFKMKHMEGFIALTKSGGYDQITQNGEILLPENYGMEIAKKIGFRQINKRQSINLAYLFTELLLLNRGQELNKFVIPFCKNHLE